MERLHSLPSVAYVNLTLNSTHCHDIDTSRPPRRDETFTWVHSNVIVNAQHRALRLFSHFD